MSTKRNDHGQFVPGNTIGIDTRFKPGNIPFNSKYKEEYVDMLYNYFTDSDKIMPTLEGFAAENHIAIVSLERWVKDEKKHPRMKAVWAQCKAIQKDKLLLGGLTERFNPQIVKFLAINNHGMKEKIEQEVNGNAKVEVTISVVD